jgi:hypothetical protein
VPKTHAERQRDYRDRQAAASRRQAERIADLEAERDQLQADLDAALAECERLTSAQCMHPAAAVDGGTCQTCGTDLW